MEAMKLEIETELNHIPRTNFRKIVEMLVYRCYNRAKSNVSHLRNTCWQVGTVTDLQTMGNLKGLNCVGRAISVSSRFICHIKEGNLPFRSPTSINILLAIFSWLCAGSRGLSYERWNVFSVKSVCQNERVCPEIICAK